MQEKKLHKLGKTDLLTLIYKQEKQIQQLTKEVETLKQQLEDRTIQIKEAGSIAEASLKLNKIFEVAQQAADEYLRSIKEVNKPSQECARINEETSKDKANTENPKDFQSENTYEENTNEKITKELILVNNKIMLPKTKLLKKVLILFMLILTKISSLFIVIARSINTTSKKIKLGTKINFIKLKCKIVIGKNCIKDIFKKARNCIIRFVKKCKAFAILGLNKTRRKIRRAFKKNRCNIEKTKRFFIKIIKAIGRGIKYFVLRISKAIKTVCHAFIKYIQKCITKCKVRLIILKFKKTNKKSYKIKLLDEAQAVDVEKPNNSLVVVNNNIILYKISILSYIKKYLKIVIVFFSKSTKKVINLIVSINKKILKIIKKIFVKIALFIKKLFKFVSKRIAISKMKFINKIKHTKLINEINEHIQIEETKNALILVETGIKPFKQKTLIKLLISLKKLKIKIKLLILKSTKRVLTVIISGFRKLVIISKKINKKIVLNIKKVWDFINNKIQKIKEKIRERKNIRQMSKDTHKAIIKNLQISMPDLEKELKRRKEKNLKIAFIKTLSFSAMVVVAFAIITSTSFFKILQVSGTSMEPTLSEGELLITSQFFKYEKGDMVAFYYNDSVLIKRVIATENDIVNIEYDGTVYVNSVKLKESYVKELSLGNCDITFPYQVPKNSVFILGDNRATSIDSRSKSLGSISTDKIIGKIQFRLNPFVIY